MMELEVLWVGRQGVVGRDCPGVFWERIVKPDIFQLPLASHLLWFSGGSIKPFF